MGGALEKWARPLALWKGVRVSDMFVDSGEMESLRLGNEVRAEMEK